MLVLGKRYIFSSSETEKLEKYFRSIVYIDLKNSIADSDRIAKSIDKVLADDKKSIVVLNTQSHIPDMLLSYLVKLESRGIKFISMETLFETYLHKCYIPEDQTNITFLEKIKPYNKVQYIQKRAIDFVSVIILGIFFMLVLPYSLYRIRKESKGSYIFKQNRVGLKSSIFTCYKLRTMHENSPHYPYTRENDSRVFPWGVTMRRMYIDELPQLWNVIKGDMHIIGPRAEWDILVKKYERDIPYYHERHLVRPGIAGWAQVNYPYGASTEDARQKLMYDLYYIKHWSPWLELKTIILTAKAMFSKKGR